MSDATNDSDNNLPSEKDANPTNDASQVQLTPIADRQKRKRKQNSFNMLKLMLQIIELFLQ